MRESRIYDHTEKVGGGERKKGPWAGYVHVPRYHSPEVAGRQSIRQISDAVLLACAGRGASATTPLRHHVWRCRATWRQAPSSRAARLDRAETRAVEHQGVLHARRHAAGHPKPGWCISRPISQLLNVTDIQKRWHCRATCHIIESVTPFYLD